MSVVRMHIDSAEGLVAACGAASANAREAVNVLSPLVTEAYDLLGMAGQNGLYGPIPALVNLANDLRTEQDDVAWRVDWLRSTDAQPLGPNGRVRELMPANLADAFAQFGLTPEQIELAEQMMRDGVSFDDAVEAANSSDPEATLDRLRLAELNDAIENWNGTDNDPILDQLLREQRDIETRIAERNAERDESWATFRRQEADSWGAAELTPLEQAERALDEIRDVLDTAKQDRGDGVGSADADGVWSTNDLEAMIENEHGYYSDEQVEYARMVLAMAGSSEDARDHLGISQSGGGWSFSDIGHLTLDVFGMVPVVGNAADGINAAWYLAEGEYLDAALSSVALIPGAGQAVTLAKPAIKAAADGMVFRNLDEALQWAKRWLEDAGILRRGDNGNPEFLYRGDNAPHSSVGREPGRVKSHVDPTTGSLVPADVDGNAQIFHHVRGSEPMKSQSPFTSMSDNGAVANRYGDHTIQVNRTQLEADIAAGKVEGVEVLSPAQVQEALQSRIDRAQRRFDDNPSAANTGSLDRALEDLENAKRDAEYLIRGTVPAGYVTVVS